MKFPKIMWVLIRVRTLLSKKCLQTLIHSNRFKLKLPWQWRDNQNAKLKCVQLEYIFPVKYLTSNLKRKTVHSWHFSTGRQNFWKVKPEFLSKDAFAELQMLTSDFNLFYEKALNWKNLILERDLQNFSELAIDFRAQ